MDYIRRRQLEDWQESAGLHAFRDMELLDMALTHSSFVKGDGNAQAHNERLEFLGDAVLELCVSRYLYIHYPGLNEGAMTRIRALAVCESALYEAAKGFGLGEILLLSRGEERTGGRDKPSILSDALEALIGALYLDGGMEAAEKLILRFAEAGIAEAAGNIHRKDHKTQLQEYAQKEHLGTLRYELLHEEGPAHRKVFTMAVTLGGKRFGSGSGASKQAAGQEAARAALEALRAGRGTGARKADE